MMRMRGDSLLRAAAVAGVLAFVAIVLIEHFAEPSLDPAQHEISEYVHGPLGWLMSVGFLLWAISLVASGLWATGSERGRPVAVALLVAAVGMVITAAFATQTSAGRLAPGTTLGMAGRLHDIGSGVATLALLAAALLSLRIPRRGLRRITLALVSFAIVADVALLALGIDGGTRQRLLVAAGCAWQLAFLGAFGRARRRSGARSDRRWVGRSAPRESEG